MNHLEAEQHAGEYRVAAQAAGPSVTVSARNGNLYLQMKLHYTQPAFRLRRYQPDIFVTPDGRPVSFRNGRMTFGDIAFVKQQ